MGCVDGAMSCDIAALAPTCRHKDVAKGNLRRVSLAYGLQAEAEALEMAVSQVGGRTSLSMSETLLGIKRAALLDLLRNTTQY